VSLQFETFRTLIQDHSRFVLTTHVNPDGDGLGAEVALALFLQSQGKQVTILNYDLTPDNYHFLEQIHPILTFDAALHAVTIEQAEVLVVLDTNHLDRLVALKPYVASSKAFKVCIDHHLEPGKFADLYMLDESSTATGEILYHLINHLTDGVIDNDIATALYTAIMTDTGSFRYPKTDAETHKIIAHLIQLGADPVSVYEQVYECGSLNRLQLLGTALANIRLTHQGRVAYIVLTRDMFANTHTSDVDTDAFVPYALTISGVQVGLMFSDLNDTVKINFRSKGNICINGLAKEFGGNGHKNAAGARIPQGRLEELIPQVLEQARTYLL